MAQTHLPLAPQRGYGDTTRKDPWWLPTLGTFLGLSGFIVYMTWAGLQNAHFTYQGYLSPAYSPLLFWTDAEGVSALDGAARFAWFGDVPAWWPGALPFLPSLLILWAPGGFRITCYYYRGAYYKAFWQSPPNCAVGKPHKTYSGERSFPLIVQNIHRYFMYLAVAFLFILAHDAYLGMWFIDPATGAKEFGIGVGTLVLTLNVTFLSMYTLGCHSLRHVIGGFKDRISGAPIRKSLYKGCTALNKSHMRWAWTSLVWVGFTDFYIRMCSMGVFTDFRII